MTGIIKPTKADMARFASEPDPDDNGCDGSAGCYGRSLGVLKHIHEDHSVPLAEILRKVKTSCPHAREAVFDYAAAFLPVGYA